MTIKFLHVRAVDSDGVLLPNGGLTVAYTELGEDSILAQIALCHDQENFCYRIGRQIAAGRLKSTKHQPFIIEFRHPIREAIVEWLETQYFEGNIVIDKDPETTMYVSNFYGDPNGPIDFEAEFVPIKEVHPDATANL